MSREDSASGPPDDPVAELEYRQRTLQEVSDIISGTDQSFNEQIDALLEVVREAIGTDYATFSYVEGDSYVFEAVDVPTDVNLHAGKIVPLDELPNCKHVVETEQTLVLRDVEEEAPELADPTWGIACYIGSPVFAGNEVYGTFCFYGMESRAEEFSDWDKTLVELVSNRVNSQLAQREREQTLRDAKLQMEAAVEAGAVGTWEWRIPEDRFIAGPSFAETFGVDPKAASEGVSLNQFVSSIHKDDRDRVQRRIDEAIESGEVYEEEYRVWNENDELRWVLARGHVEYDDDGNPQTFPGALIDITDRKHAEQQLESLNSRLKKSNKRLEQFAYAASHDLQEPLRMVSSYLRLLENRYGDTLDEDAHEFLDFAVNGADRMRNMIDELLAYSRVESHGSRFRPVNLNDVLADVQTDLQRQIAEKTAEITVENLPQVEGDANQFRQLFRNLLENSLEYSGDEPPRIHVSADQDGNGVVIAVQDEGIGIEPDAQERIFEEFERLHSREEHTGTGIGLALCQRIVERHDGEIWVESEPGEGSTFFVSFPISPI
ncbi:ATP-binding protein [Natrinema sp. LN54]|uniref:ATP-binding protein n=1 Tax=Natrinema sp. LN54 TaxID=3458705 RepID=UPI0040373CF0